MMGPWTIRETLMSVGAALLLCSICYFVGKKDGRMDEKLSRNKTQIHASDSSNKSVQIRTDSVRHNSDVLFAYRNKVREKVVVKRDTITVHDSVVVVSPEIAQLIEADDSTIKALQRSIALQDTLIAGLRHGIELRDERIKLLESEVSPSKVKRIITAAKYIGIGVVVGVAWAHR